MSRTKKSSSERPRQAPSAAALNGPASEVLTLAEAAAYLRLTEAEVLRLVDEQALPVRQLGTERRFLKAGIQRWLSAGTPPPTGKQAQLAVAGAWQDDPLVDEELREAYGRRGGNPGAEEP